MRVNAPVGSTLAVHYTAAERPGGATTGDGQNNPYLGFLDADKKPIYIGSKIITLSHGLCVVIPPPHRTAGPSKGTWNLHLRLIGGHLDIITTYNLASFDAVKHRAQEITLLLHTSTLNRPNAELALYGTPAATTLVEVRAREYTPKQLGFARLLALVALELMKPKLYPHDNMPDFYHLAMSRIIKKAQIFSLVKGIVNNDRGKANDTDVWAQMVDQIVNLARHYDIDLILFASNVAWDELPNWIKIVPVDILDYYMQQFRTRGDADIPRSPVDSTGLPPKVIVKPQAPSQHIVIKLDFVFGNYQPLDHRNRVPNDITDAILDLPNSAEKLLSLVDPKIFDKLRDLCKREKVLLTYIPPRPTQTGNDRLRPFAQALARKLGCNIDSYALRWNAPSRSQIGLSASARVDNVMGKLTASSAVAGRHVLLIDDIFTTGATMNAAVMALKLAASASVHTAACRTMPP